MDSGNVNYVRPYKRGHFGMLQDMLAERLKNVAMAIGCFDILHCGHVRLLKRCRDRGGQVVVALNSDASVRRLKGEGRPVNCLEHRKEMLLACRYVDAVRVFDTEDDLEQFIRELKPAVIIVGPPHNQPSNKEAIMAEWGGEVTRLTEQPDSTTAILERTRA